MDWGSVILSLVLLGLVALVIARPVIRQRRSSSKSSSVAEALRAEREAILTALRDLDFDHATGKVCADDYQPQRAELLARGVAVLKQMDAQPAATNHNGHSGDSLERRIAARRRRLPADSSDDALEAAIAARRRSVRQPSPETANCPHCRALVRAEDKFCFQCGQFLDQRCGQCGSQVQPEDKFCGRCGAKLNLTESVE